MSDAVRYLRIARPIWWISCSVNLVQGMWSLVGSRSVETWNKRSPNLTTGNYEFLHRGLIRINRINAERLITTRDRTFSGILSFFLHVVSSFVTFRNESVRLRIEQKKRRTEVRFVIRARASRFISLSLLATREKIARFRRYLTRSTLSNCGGMRCLLEKLIPDKSIQIMTAFKERYFNDAVTHLKKRILIRHIF